MEDVISTTDSHELEKNAVLAKKMKNVLTRTQGHVLSLQKIS